MICLYRLFKELTIIWLSNYYIILSVKETFEGLTISILSIVSPQNSKALYVAPSAPIIPIKCRINSFAQIPFLNSGIIWSSASAAYPFSAEQIKHQEDKNTDNKTEGRCAW